MRIVTITSFAAKTPGSNKPAFLSINVSFVDSTSILKIGS